MLTPLDIQEKQFDRVRKGYDVDSVDAFLDELAEDYTALSKENASLKGKLRTLAEKMEEYRQTEDSMRLALLSAQKMSAQIEAEARARAESIIKAAESKAANIEQEIQADIANEQAKLNEAQKATKKYVDHMISVCKKQVDFYDQLMSARLVPGPKAKAAAKEEEETVRSIESSAVKAALQEPEVSLPIDADADATRHFAAETPPRTRKRSREDYRFEDLED